MELPSTNTGRTRHGVSVIIPVRNGEKFLREAIDSVLGQSVAPYEIIVVDDGSTDSSAAIAQSYGRITCIRQAPAGQSRARNRGVECSTGNYLAFLDADDLWAPDKLERQLEAFRESSPLAAVFAHAIEFSEQDDGGRPIPIGAAKPAHHPGALLIERRAFAMVGPFHEGREVGQVGEVVEWYARALDRALPILTLDNILFMRRIHGDNIGLTASDPATDYLRTLRLVIERRRGGR